MHASRRAWLTHLLGPVLAAAMFVAVAPHARAQQTTGAIPGDFAVGPSGDAQYTIPIDVPPGIGDMHPVLGFAYGSFTGNGKLGVGWSLTGFSAITRCKAVPYADGFWGSINYDQNDRYCLDGQRLINTAAAYGSAGAVYHTELETWRLVQSSTALCGSGPCSFTVVSRGGVQWLYGTSSDSRILAADGTDVRAWALEQIVDPDGNTISFEYTNNPLGATPPPADEDYYPASIAYTSNGSFAANRSVTFAYQPRPDVDTRFEGGTQVVTHARLASIATSVQNTPALNYGLSYATSDVTGRSLVTAIMVCAGAPGSNPCLTSTSFDWQGADQLDFAPTDLPTQLTSGYTQLFPVDTNGDGRGDLVYTWTSPGFLNIDVYKSTGTDLVPCTSPFQIGDAGTPLVSMDINGDGRADLLQVAPSPTQTQSFYWYLAQPDGCSFDSGGPLDTTLPLQPDVVWPMDMNGDGRGDLVQGWLDEDTMTLSSLISNGNGFDEGATQTLTLGESSQLWPADVNGDGLVDIIQSWTGANGSLTLTVYRSDGTQFVDGTDSLLSTANSGTFLQVDVNEDGLVDVVQAWSDEQNLLHLTTWLADGAGHLTSGGDVDTGRGVEGTLDLWPLDLTGDFGTDLVQIWNNDGQINLVIYRRNPGGTTYDTGTVSATPLASAEADDTWPMDIDGDSRMELVQAWPSDGPGALMLTTYAVTGPPADLISTITDGLNGQIAITYSSMSDPTIYTPAAGTYPQAPGMAYEYRAAPAEPPYHVVSGGNAQLVSGYTFQSPSAAISGAYSYPHSLQYNGAAVDMTGHGWLGFAAISDTNLGNGRVITTTYNQQFPLTGTIATLARQCVSLGVGIGDPQCTSTTPVTLQVQATTYQSVHVASSDSGLGAVWTALPSSVRSDTFSYGVYNFSIGSAFQYDQYSNVTVESYLGYVSSSGSDISPDDNVYTCTAYSNTVSATGWTLGFPTAIKKSSNSSCSDYGQFDAGDFSLANMVYTPTMHLATLNEWDSSNSVYLTSLYTYDSFGNTLTTSAPGNRVTTWTYETSYNTYELTQTTPPNESGVSLASTYGYDPRFGTLVAVTDQNGLTSITCLDPFGGLAAFQSPIPSFATTTADANCVPQSVTGPAPSFQAAKVVAVEAQSLGNDLSGNVYMEVDQLQSWSPGTTRDIRWHRTYYDGLGRGYQEVDQGPASSGNIVVCRTYDAQDSILTASLSYFFAGNEDNCSPRQSDPRLWVTNTYDAYGRITRAVRPAGPTGTETSTTMASYSGGDTETFTYASGDSYALTKTRRYRYYDSARKLSQLIFVSDSNATSSFGYDGIGRLTSAVDPPTASNPNGVSNTMSYDSLDRPTSASNPDQSTSGGVATLWTYDPKTGFATSSTDAKGQRTVFAYDALARQTQMTEADGTVTSFGYDDPQTSNGQGRLCHVTAASPGNPDGLLYKYDFAYDGVDQPASRTVTLGSAAGSYTTQIHHDPLQRVWQLIYPDGSVLTNTFSAGNLVQSAIGATTYASYSNFTPRGQPQNVAYGNGATAGFSYAPTGEVITQSVTDSAGTALSSRTLTWNHLGHVTASTDNLGQETSYSQSYTYTNGRLSSVQAPSPDSPQSYGYDASGNLITVGATQYAYEAHRITTGTQSGETVFSAGYDANGNMSSKTVGDDQWSYTYDTLNRLAAVTHNGTEVLSVPLYDHLNARLIRADSDQTNSLYVDPAYVVTEVPGQYVAATKYVFFGGEVVAAITTPVSGSAPDAETLYYHTDYLNSTSLTTTSEGTLSSIFAYAPYGALTDTGTAGPEDVRQKYTGQELDEDSGLYYFGARYYDPATGRFITPDTMLAAQLDDTDSLNRYALALNNPTSFTDSSGHSVDSIFGAILGGLEILGGLAVDVLSGGALEPGGGALVGAGINALDYSLSHTHDFSFKQYGMQTGIGAAMGLFTGGFGGDAAGLAQGGASIAEREIASAAPFEERAAMETIDGAELRTGADAARQGDSAFTEDDEGDLTPCVSSAASFAAGTTVPTEEGPKPVEAIAVGDFVFGFDAETGEADTYRVTGTTVQPESTLFRISAAGIELEAAPAELFRVAGDGWKEARQLEAGDFVVDAGGRHHVVECVTPLDVRRTVYELEVATVHTFYASEAALLVHNGKGKPKVECLRKKYMGSTPSKNSGTGKTVFAKWRARGDARIRNGKREVNVQKYRNSRRRYWVAMDRKIHMGHIKDAVIYWNKEGRFSGPRSPEVRKFMRDPLNYRFEWGPLNSSNGARLGVRYLPPTVKRALRRR